MKNLYTQLSIAFTDEEDKDAKNKPLNFHELSHFVSMKGKLYDAQKCRFLLVGRAVNGWGSISHRSSEEFGAGAEQKFLEKGFDWVISDKDGLHNKPDINSGEKIYYLSKSPFWRTAKQIWEHLSGDSQSRWIDYIAWSNIYKVAPKDTGNPTTKMCKIQIEACRKILKEEIETYNPTHILFITGWNWWFDDEHFGVSELFEDCKPIGENKRDNSFYVEGTAIYKGNSVDIPVIIACRPEQREEKAYVEQIVGAFEKLEGKR